MIRSIVEQTKTTVDIDDDGLVIIGSSDEAAARRAIEIIEGLTKEIEIGSIYTGKVTRLLSFGAFVEITPGKEGMVHISELANYHVPTIEDEVKVGDEITVKVIKNDEGKIGLSRKAVFEDTPVPVGGTRPPARGAGGFRRREPHSRPPDRGQPRRCHAGADQAANPSCRPRGTGPDGTRDCQRPVSGPRHPGGRGR